MAGSLSRVFQGPWAVQTPRAAEQDHRNTLRSLLLVRVELALLIPAPLWEQRVLRFWTGAGTQPLPAESFGQADGQQVRCFCSTAQDPSKELRGGNRPLPKKACLCPDPSYPRTVQGLITAKQR